MKEMLSNLPQFQDMKAKVKWKEWPQSISNAIY